MLGIISDTHGLLRPEALAALAGSELIIHAGDVGRHELIRELERIAPVVAVRGNVDVGSSLPAVATVEHAGIRVCVLHRPQDLDFDPAARGFGVVIVGHTHKSAVQWRGGVLHLNPGSAGPRRFKLPVTLAHLHIDSGVPRAEIVTLL
jgi:putative phosphoesterase